MSGVMGSARLRVPRNSSTPNCPSNDLPQQRNIPNCHIPQTCPAPALNSEPASPSATVTNAPLCDIRVLASCPIRLSPRHRTLPARTVMQRKSCPPETSMTPRSVIVCTLPVASQHSGLTNPIPQTVPSASARNTCTPAVWGRVNPCGTCADQQRTSVAGTNIHNCVVLTTSWVGTDCANNSMRSGVATSRFSPIGRLPQQYSAVLSSRAQVVSPPTYMSELGSGRATSCTAALGDCCPVPS